MHAEPMPSLLPSPSRQPTVLWIAPDAVSGHAGTPVDLQLRGDRARSIYEALTRLDSTAYDAIVMHFTTAGPDCLSAIASVRQGRHRTPILVVAGGADVAFAVNALRSGATHFRTSPCRPDEILHELDGLLRAVDPEALALTALATRLDRAAGLGDVLPIDIARRAIVAALAATLSRSRQPRHVLASAASLRSVLRTSGCAGPRQQAAHAKRMLERRLRRTAEPRLTLVRAALTHLHDLVSDRKRPKEYEVAAGVGADAGHLGRLMREDTGLTFCQWRTAIGLMVSARELVETRNQVSQIAYRVGYDHPSQFAREFERHVGVSPTGYRQLWVAVDPDTLLSEVA